jgi:hypothetical protein
MYHDSRPISGFLTNPPVFFPVPVPYPVPHPVAVPLALSGTTALDQHRT